MTPDQARGMYRRQIDQHGEWMQVVHALTGKPAMKLKVRGRINGYIPEELGGTNQQGERSVIILAEDLDNVPFDPPLGTNGAYKLQRDGGDYLNVESVDSNTRRIQGTLIAYDIKVTGL